MEKKKKKSTSRGSTVEMQPESEDAIAWVQEWSRYNRKEIVNAAVACLPRLGKNTCAAMIGSVPEELEPDFAKMVLENLARTNQNELKLSAAANISPESSTGKSPPTRE